MMTSKDFTPSKNKGLLLATLSTVYVNQEDFADGYLLYRNLIFKLQPDLFLSQYMKDHKIAKAVVSFQCYPNQDNVAVARLHRELV